MPKFGDTPDLSGSSLCKSCRNSHIIEGQKLSDNITYCMKFGEFEKIAFPVTKCSGYDDKALPSLWDMQKIAYRFSVDDKKKTAGFLDPKAWRKKREDEHEPFHEDL